MASGGHAGQLVAGDVTSVTMPPRPTKWIFLGYTLASEPSKARVALWRRLKKLGAINFEALWVLPHSTKRVAEAQALIAEIERQQGHGVVVVGTVPDEQQEERIRAAFVGSRNQEYQELIEKCGDYAKEIEYEIGRRNFIFAEVEENEEELEKLKDWLRKIERRDLVDAPLHGVAVAKVADCERLFEDFSRRVYEHAST
jgi:hypothetical protein